MAGYLLDYLQTPAPQYVIGCLPVIITIGVAPDNGCVRRLLWILRCLGCPFTGIFYHCNIMNDETLMCVYWLSSGHFIEENGDRSSRRPVGHHSMLIVLSPKQIEYVNECISEASILDRFSSILSAYYIIVGIFVAMYRMLGTCTPQDWPYFPLSLSWTLPAIYKRVYGGKIIANDPRKIFLSTDNNDSNNIIDKIHLKKYSISDKKRLDTYVIITALFTIIIPWTTVILAYFTPPKGFGCRSKYLTVVCTIWSFNSILAYFYHKFKGEKDVNGDIKIHSWFCFCGVLIAILLILLALLSHTTSWWVTAFGEACDISNVCNKPGGNSLPI
ncbi:5346_t:CDS:1 [Dentiscutata erythropus]|uniref:5346_t:CDS:1 n=1 Tax=Dentiscutata erythropus TaxID=1348616 RepID=A0A9N9HMP5_9GLOM|nr:5346_t:CDS:1 [Dentiscutata erythropus]